MNEIYYIYTKSVLKWLITAMKVNDLLFLILYTYLIFFIVWNPKVITKLSIEVVATAVALAILCPPYCVPATTCHPNDSCVYWGQYNLLWGRMGHLVSTSKSIMKQTEKQFISLSKMKYLKLKGKENNYIKE